MAQKRGTNAIVGILSITPIMELFWLSDNVLSPLLNKRMSIV